MWPNMPNSNGHPRAYRGRLEILHKYDEHVRGRMFARSIEHQLADVRRVTALRDLKYVLECPSQTKRSAKVLRNSLYMRDNQDGVMLLDAGHISCKSLRGHPYVPVLDYTGQE